MRSFLDITHQGLNLLQRTGPDPLAGQADAVPHHKPVPPSQRHLHPLPRLQLTPHGLRHTVIKRPMRRLMKHHHRRQLLVGIVQLPGVGSGVKQGLLGCVGHLGFGTLGRRLH